MSSLNPSSRRSLRQRLFLFIVGSFCLGLLLTGFGPGASRPQTEPTADQRPFSPSAAPNDVAVPLAPSLAVTKTDTLVGDVDMDGMADPGDLLSYTVTIHNVGDMDATGVVFSDTIDGNTTLSGTVHVSPIAFADSYTSTGNVGITVPTGSGLLSNDVDPDNNSGSLTVVGFDATSANGGDVTVAADGSFTYDPPPGFTGGDSFTYTLSDGDPVTPDDVETVTITVSELVWFIDNSQGVGDGRLGSPFNTLAAFAAVNGSGGNNPGVGDCIFIYETGSGIYTGGVTPANSQVLIGQGATDSIANLCSLTLPPFSNGLPATSGSRPTISNTPGTGHAVTLATDNLLRGFNIGDTDTGFGLSGATVGTAVVSEMGISGSGGLVDIDTGTLNMTFDSLTTTGGSAEGIDLDSVGGTFVTAGTLSIANTGAGGIDINNSTAAFTFSGATKSITTGTQPGVNLTNNSGATFDFTNGGLAIQTTTGTGFRAIGGGTVNVTGVNTIGATTPLNKTAVQISDTTIGAGAITFEAIFNDQGATTSDVPAIILENTGSGAFHVTGSGTTAGSGGTLENILADAITLNNTDGVVTLENMIIEDIGSTGGTFSTRSRHDAIHGQQVDGGLVLDNVTIRRISDMAINGALFADGISGTVWNGLQITDSTFQDSNRFHVAGTGDTSDEGMIRIVGIRGTVTVNNSSFERGGELIDFFVTAGTLTMTAMENSFNFAYKEFSSGGVSSIGKICVDVTVQGSANATVTIGDTADTTTGHQVNDGGNDFLNCRIASVRIANDAGATGDVDAIVANNTIVVDDHSSGIGGDFDFPMGGVKYSTRGTNSATFDGLITHNYFDELTNADGGVGQVTLDMDGGQSQVRINNNTFDTPGNAPWYIRADNAGNVGTMNLTLLLENNTYIRGFFSCPDPSCGGGYDGPGLRSLVQVQDGGDVDVTLNQEDLAQHDTGFDPGNTVEFQLLNVGAAGTMCVNLTNNTSPHGYALERSAGTLNLEQGVSASTTPAVVVDDNGNTGGGGNPAQDPPTVSTFGTINVVMTACAQPGGGIFAQTSWSVLAENRLMDTIKSPFSYIEPNKYGMSQSRLRSNGKFAESLFERLETETVPAFPIKGTVADISPAGLLSGETADVTLGTLEPDQTVTIIFQAAVDDPLNSAATQVCNQAVVSSNELSDVLSDDPDVGGGSDPTCTPLDLEADLTLTKTESIDPVVPGSGTGNLTSRCSLSAGTHTFNQTTRPVTITVNTAGTLDCITIIPTAGDHPNAMTGIADTSDLHWTISATGSGFNVDVTFPADTVTGDASMFKTCRTDDNGANWDCVADTDGNPGTVSRTSVTAFSAWQNCGGCGPTAVSLQTSAARSTTVSVVWLWLTGLLLSLSAIFVWRRRHLPQ